MNHSSKRAYTPFREIAFRPSRIAPKHLRVHCTGFKRRRPHEPYGSATPRF